MLQQGHFRDVAYQGISNTSTPRDLYVGVTLFASI
jgi:hypothetical protein